MGRATITGGGTDGRYSIEVDLGQEQKAAMLATITAGIARAEINIATAQAALNEATDAALITTTALNATINAYAAASAASTDPQDLKDELEAYKAALIESREKQAAVTVQQIEVRKHQAIKAELNKRLVAVNSITSSLARDAWCADFTEDASGEVGTLEVPGEQNLILIKPGAPAPGPSDGQLVARGVQSPEQAYYNTAVLPGWQKWKPTYRTGVISNIDTGADTATVTLDAATSSAQTLNVNQDAVLTGVPVEYMECNAEAFEDGDGVVVQFDGQDWNAPKIVGFVDNPKMCIDWPTPLYIIVETASENLGNPGPAYRPIVYDYGLDAGCGPQPQEYAAVTSALITYSVHVSSIQGVPTNFVATGIPQGAGNTTIWSETANAAAGPHNSSFGAPADMVPPASGSSGVDYWVRTPYGLDEIRITRYTKEFPEVSYDVYVYFGPELGCLLSSTFAAIDGITPSLSTEDIAGPMTFGEFVAEYGTLVTGFTLTYKDRVTRTYQYVGSKSYSVGLGRLVYELVETP